MNTIPGEQLHRLCEMLFAFNMAAPSIIDGNIVHALCPDDESFYLIEREGSDNAHFYVVSWLASGEKMWGDWYSTSPLHIKAQQDPHHSMAPPPAELLSGLAKALPMPSYWLWGVVEDGHIREMIIFGGPSFDEEVSDHRPSAIFVFAQDQQDNLGSQLYNNKWLNIAKFWEFVNAGKLVCLKPHLTSVSAFQWGMINDYGCIVVGKSVLAPAEVWAEHRVLTPADLRDITDLTLT